MIRGVSRDRVECLVVRVARFIRRQRVPVPFDARNVPGAHDADDFLHPFAPRRSMHRVRENQVAIGDERLLYSVVLESSHREAIPREVLLGPNEVDHLLAASPQLGDVLHGRGVDVEEANVEPALLHVVQLGGLGTAARLVHEPPRFDRQAKLDRDRHVGAIPELDLQVLRAAKDVVEVGVGSFGRFFTKIFAEIHGLALRLVRLLRGPGEPPLPNPRRRDLHVHIPEHHLRAHLLRRVDRREKLRPRSGAQDGSHERVAQRAREGNPPAGLEHEIELGLHPGRGGGGG
mmetsp:Transcript_8083/g.22479  ORF Transcript_8083/g.22479 Transcript_8083/m.22479 type:complete len:289 (+) Transcript_8083:3994-4860(+)